MSEAPSEKGAADTAQAVKSPLQTGTRLTWLGLAAVAMLFAVVAGYYVSHKPVTPDNAWASLRGAVDLLLAGVLVALGGGIGRRLAPAPHVSTAASLCMQAAIGLGWMGLGALLVGALGGASPAVAWAALLLLGAIFGRSALRWCAAWRGRVASVARAGRAAHAAFALAGVALGLALLEAAAPPVHFDALVYHLELPRLFLAQRSFALTADNPFWGLPLMGEALYTWALALGRLQTAAILGWMAAVLALVGVVGLGASWAKPAGWVGMLALIGGVSLSASPGWAYVDWWSALFAVGMLVALDAYRRSPSRSLALLGGLLGGFACGVKYTAWLIVPAGFLAFCVADRSRRGLLNASVFALTAVLVAMPWIIKNTLATRAPLYPYLGATAWMPPERQTALMASVVPPPAWIGLSAPLGATLLGHEQAPGFASDIGPLLLGLLPGLALLPRATRSRLMPAGVYLFAGWGIWALASTQSGLLIQTRLYFVVLPAWALLAGAGFAGLERSRVGNVRLGRLAAAVVFLVVGLLTFQQVRQTVNVRPAPVLLGDESEASYLGRRLGSTYYTQQALAGLPMGSRVLMLWEPRALYCAPRCVADPWIDRWLLERRLLGAPELIRQAWGQEGVTHVLLFETGRAFVERQDPRYTRADWLALDELLHSLRRIEAAGEGYALYELP